MASSKPGAVQARANPLQALTRQAASRQSARRDKGERWQQTIDAAVPPHPNAGSINAPLLAALYSAGNENEALERLSRALPELAPDDLIDELSRLLLAAEMAGRLSFEKHG